LIGRRYVLGVDGGATKTVALIGTEDGKILGRGQSGSSNYHNVGVRAASLSVRRAVADARKQAKIRSNSVRVAVVALAAADSNRDRANVLRFVRQMKIARKSVVVHDTLAALQAATGGRPGIIVISGTGCVAAGVNGAGRYVRVGGWGYVIDDEGSGYDIGTKALRSAFRTIDGRAPYTRLTPSLKRRFQVGRLEDALNAIYSGELGVNGVAALAPLVSRLAPVDRVCRDILSRAGESLAELSCAVAKQLGMTHDAFPIALVGGTFKAGSYLLRPLVTTVRKECPRANVKILKVEPALGALSLAVKEFQNCN
jgi:N-acetylglucosamine kinase-like BadF-type ATPase